MVDSDILFSISYSHADDILEGMMNNASDNDIDYTVKVINYLCRLLKTNETELIYTPNNELVPSPKYSDGVAELSKSKYGNLYGISDVKVFLEKNKLIDTGFWFANEVDFYKYLNYVIR